jgi:hypothetical protein
VVGLSLLFPDRRKKPQEWPRSRQERLREEIEMSRIALICFCTALLAACGTESPTQTALAQERLACANVGIDPASPAFGQCVGDLDLSLLERPR